MLEQVHVSRRALVRALLLAAGMKPALLAVARSAHAFSQAPIIPGVQDFRGEFRINGVPARRGDVVKPGDIATTGPDSSAVVIIGRHAFMLRANSTIEFYPVYFEDEGVVSGVLKVAAGAMLSVFGETRETTVTTPLATVGIRGTGCYVESRPDRTYACVCYGRADLSTSEGQLLETIKSSRHDMPRFIYPPDTPQRITKAPIFDHGDAELRLLESLVHRTPPFDDNNDLMEDRY